MEANIKIAERALHLRRWGYNNRDICEDLGIRMVELKKIIDEYRGSSQAIQGGSNHPQHIQDHRNQV